jgi:hypothetical protein
MVAMVTVFCLIKFFSEAAGATVARKKRAMDPNQADLFGEAKLGPADGPAKLGEVLRDVHEVFAFVREYLGLAPLTPQGTPQGKVARPGDPPADEVPPLIAEARARRAEKANARGLTAKWSKEFGFISVHDPVDGTWHDVPTAPAEPWMKWEAGTRKTMYKAGRRDAYDLTSAEMAQIWAEEHRVEEVEGIIEEHPLAEDDEE